MSDDKPQTYSVALRLRRVTYEDAYVAVRVTSKIVERQEDGSGRINMDAFVAEAIRLGEHANVEWRVESSKTEPHPMQGPKPDDRKMLDGFYIEKPARDEE